MSRRPPTALGSLAIRQEDALRLGIDKEFVAAGFPVVVHDFRNGESFAGEENR